jgi:hypothetical protein
MRFPVSREDGGNASALSLSAEAAAGNPSREKRGARSADALETEFDDDGSVIAAADLTLYDG